ncbi:MAG: class I SAM-dependent methyltransferase [Deltaproteobacteria bacterium]|nr:class I SAM-dependent methyltransferase [Deltaproteobacteria bacterium]
MKYSITKILNFGAGIYDRWAKHNLREIYKRLTELADLKGNEKVLDIGCGPGNLDLMIAEILDEGFIHGIDIAPKMIEIAREKAKERGYDIDYRVGNSTKLPYESCEFDVVFTCLLYHHLSHGEKDQTLKEIYRVLEPNGRYISLEFQEFPTDVFHRIFLKLSTGNSGIMHGLHPAELIEGNKFHTEKQIKGSPFWKHHHTSYRVLIKK